jgi:hypothetical protein
MCYNNVSCGGCCLENLGCGAAWPVTKVELKRHGLIDQVIPDKHDAFRRGEVLFVKPAETSAATPTGLAPGRSDLGNQQFGAAAQASIRQQQLAPPLPLPCLVGQRAPDIPTGGQPKCSRWAVAMVLRGRAPADCKGCFSGRQEPPHDGAFERRAGQWEVGSSLRCQHEIVRARPARIDGLPASKKWFICRIRSAAQGCMTSFLLLVYFLKNSASIASDTAPTDAAHRVLMIACVPPLAGRDDSTAWVK